MAAPPRTGLERMTDAISMFEAIGADAWVATASEAGVAHLVPLSYAWQGSDIILAAVATSVTARNIEKSGRARLAFGPTRDLVIVDTMLKQQLPVDAASDDLAEAYARQADWDPRREKEPYVFVVLRPNRIQAWREANELAGRTLMRDGVWLF